jgi:hypothetical protein
MSQWAATRVPEATAAERKVHVRSMNWVGTALVCLMVVGFTRPAAAQGTPKAEASGGYSWFTAKVAGGDDWKTFPKGWYVDVAGKVTDRLSIDIVGQVTVNDKHFDVDDSDLKVRTYMAGLRGGTSGRVRGFGQFLIGAVTIKASDSTDSASETDFGVQLGGGVNVLGSGNVGLRLGVDYLRVMTSATSAVFEGVVLEGPELSGLRFNIGVTVGFGTR